MAKKSTELKKTDSIFLMIITWPKIFDFGQVLFSSACMCLSVCLSVFISIISKSSRPILMKLGRMVHNDIIQVPFEDELNRPIRTEVRDH